MKKSFYIISAIVIISLGITIFGQITTLISNNVITPNSILTLVLDCVYIFGIIGIFLKKQWAPVILSASILISSVGYLANTNFSIGIRVEMIVINLVLVFLNILIYRHLKNYHNQLPIQRKIFVPILAVSAVLFATTVYYCFFNIQIQTRIYTNTEYGYQLTLPNEWTVPTTANAYIDLYRKESVEISGVLDRQWNIGTSTEITVADKKALSDFDKKIAEEVKTWDLSTAQFIMLTNASVDEQSTFYAEVNKKEKVITDFFPSRTIQIYPSDSLARLSDTPTSTPRKIGKTITLSNGTQAEYKKLIHPTIGATFVTVPMTSDKFTYEGKKINSLVFSHSKEDISDEDFMVIINSLVFIK